MKLVPLTLAVCAFLALVARAADDHAQSDLEKLQGLWKVTSVESDGKKSPEDSVKNIRMTVKGEKLVWKEDNKEEEATCKLDSSQKPKAMDMIIKVGDKMETVKLIYDLKGDDLKLCGGKAGKDRPKDFAAKAGSGLSLIVLKREKE